MIVKCVYMGIWKGWWIFWRSGLLTPSEKSIRRTFCIPKGNYCLPHWFAHGNNRCEVHYRRINLLQHNLFGWERTHLMESLLSDCGWQEVLKDLKWNILVHIALLEFCCCIQLHEESLPLFHISDWRLGTGGYRSDRRTAESRTNIINAFLMT